MNDDDDLLASVPGDTLLLCVAIAFHFGYSTFSIGGDYFEYRIYSHLVPLLFVSGAWLAARVVRRPALSLALLGSFVLASWPVAWTHWAVAPRNRREGFKARSFKLAPYFPGFVRPVLEPYDAWQAWLFAHFVCVRQPTHATMCAWSLARLPSREEGSLIRWEPDHPTMGLIGVGVPGWLLPEVAVIDLLGLNDRVVARAGVHEGERRMAHDRMAPAGYLEAFRPNVRFERRGQDYVFVVDPRETPLTDADIRAAEARFWADVQR
jgi:arabinofuranosyltransferase